MNMLSLKKKLESMGIQDCSVNVTDQSIRIAGIAASLAIKNKAGWYTAKFGANVVNNIITKNYVQNEDSELEPNLSNELEGLSYDVIIIGGGVIGCAIARELSKFTLTVALFEKEYDVAVHTSSRNDGMIHDGFAAKPGTKKAHYNVRGNRLWEPLARDLGIQFKRVGSLILFRSPMNALLYPILAHRAKKNNVDGWELWSKEKVKKEEPFLLDEQHGGFYLPSAGIISPYRATVALAEHAVQNGAAVHLSTKVFGFEIQDNEILRVQTNRGTVQAKLVINAAGNWADRVADLANDKYFSLHFRKGTDIILDKNTGKWQHHVAAMPNFLQIAEKTKGGGLVPTIEGNVLVGPTAKEIEERADYSTSQNDIQELEKHIVLNKKLNLNQVITYFSGVRACTYSEDFLIEQSKKIKNLIHVAGIQSPGLASAPAIAEDVAIMSIQILSVKKSIFKKDCWNPTRNAYPDLQKLSFKERAELIKKNPGYGKIVCRCEAVSEQEVRDVLHSSLPVCTLDAIKRRVRPGAGRCHGGFCTPRVIEILAEETGNKFSDITKKGSNSNIVLQSLEDHASER